MTQPESFDEAEYNRLISMWPSGWDEWDVDARLRGVPANPNWPGDTDIPPIPGLLEPWLAFMRAYAAYLDSQREA